MLIDIPTLFLAIIVESFAMLLAAGLLARYSENNRCGMRWMTASMGFLSLSFVFLGLREIIPPLVSIFFGNVGASAMLLAFTLALTEFQRISTPRLMVWAPLGLIAAVSLIFSGNITARIILFSMVILVQEGYIAYLLILQRRRVSGIGQFLVLCGIVLSMGTLSLRLLVTLFGIEVIRHLFDGSIAQALLYLTTFLTLNLISLGYILMNKEAEDEKYRQLALRDNLTQCWNRNHLESAARQEMQRLQRYGSPVSLVILDIDLFKAVNDHHGHAIGDEILRGFADTARACIRSTDILARWGGEEFALLLPSSGYSAAASIAERIRQEFSAAAYAEVKATVSAGYAICQTTDTWDDWFQRADRALYRAKSLGRNRVEPEIPLLPADFQLEQIFKVAWQRDFQVGNVVIDEQHERLFRLADQLQRSICQGATREQIEADVGDFMLRLQDHFRTEDSFLSRHDHPEALAHRELHQKLTRHAEQLLERFRENRIEPEILVQFIVLEVTVQHILIADRTIAHFVGRLGKQPDGAR